MTQRRKPTLFLEQSLIFRIQFGARFASRFVHENFVLHETNKRFIFYGALTKTMDNCMSLASNGQGIRKTGCVQLCPTVLQLIVTMFSENPPARQSCSFG